MPARLARARADQRRLRRRRHRTGDADRFIDPAHPEPRPVFDGRTAEDFKLSTGTFVSCRPLGPCTSSPLARPACRTVVGRAEPRRDRPAGLPAHRRRRSPPLAAARGVAGAGRWLPPAVHEFFQHFAHADQLMGPWAPAARRGCACWPSRPRSTRAGSPTGGSINQRAVRSTATRLVERCTRAAAIPSRSTAPWA